MSLETTTYKIDGILSTVVLIVSGVLWAFAGFPYLFQVVVVAGLVVIATVFFVWQIGRFQKKT